MASVRVPQSTIWSHIKKNLSRLGADRPFHLSSKQEAYLVELVKEVERFPGQELQANQDGLWRENTTKCALVDLPE